MATAPPASAVPGSESAESELINIKVESAASGELSSYAGEGAALEEQIAGAIAAHNVVLFIKPWCPFCLEVKAMLEQLDVTYASFDLEAMPNGSAVHAALKRAYGHKTVPYVFIGGEFVGGCDDTKALQKCGALHRRLHGVKATKSPTASAAPPKALPAAAPVATATAKAATSDIASSGESFDGSPRKPGKAAAVAAGAGQGAFAPNARQAPRALFYFPDTVDDNTARLVALMTCAFSIIAAVLHERRGMHYACLGLTIDIGLRAIFGPGPSLMTQISKLFMFRFQPTLKAGIMLQTALFMAFAMSSIGTLLLFLPLGDNDIAGAVVFAALAVPTFLMGGVGWCAACWMVGLGIKWGLVPSSIFTVHVDEKPEVLKIRDFGFERHPLPKPEIVTVQQDGHPPTKLDLRYKHPKEEFDVQRMDFHPIRHMTALHFNIALSWLGLAVAWKVAAQPQYGLHISATVGHVLGITSTVIFLALLLLYIMRACLYPKKIRKDWMSPLKGNTLVVIPCCIVLLSFLAAGEFDNSVAFAKVLFWLGAPAILAMGFLRVAFWLGHRVDEDSLNAAWIMTPVGALIASLVGPALDPRYTEACHMWFGFAVIMWVVLFTITFQRAVLGPNPDDRLRPLLWVWVAAPAVAASAYVALTAVPLAPTATAAGAPVFDFFAKMLYFIALTLAASLGCGLLNGFFGRGKFELGDWGYAFPLDALAITTVQYSGAIGGRFPMGMAYAGLAISSYTIALVTMQTLTLLSIGGVFRPEPKFGPLSMMRLTHEAFKEMMPRLEEQLDLLTAMPSAAATGRFVADIRQFILLLEEHLAHEDEVVFKTFAEFFPGSTNGVCHDHEDHAKAIEAINALLEQLEGADNDKAFAATAASLQPALARFFVDLLEHLKVEEAHMMPIGRKYVSMGLQRELLRRVWNTTPVQHWRIIMPKIVNSLPYLQQRVKYIRCWTWAMPERAQLLGLLLAEGCDAVQWGRLVEHVPEIIPRGAPGYVRYF